MLYNDIIDYNQSGIQYNGTVVLIIEGISNPVILNDIKVNFGGKEDYSVATAIGVVSIDLAPSGVITIQALQKEGAALIQASEITIHSGTLITIEISEKEGAGIIQTTETSINSSTLVSVQNQSE
jgi:hypothetical protein